MLRKNICQYHSRGWIKQSVRFQTAPERTTKECTLEKDNLIEKKHVETKNQYRLKNLVSTLGNTHLLSEVKVIMTTEVRNSNEVKLRYLKNRK